VTDTLGLLLRVKVHRADLQDRAAVPLVGEGMKEQFPRISLVWVDQGYTGVGKTWIEEHLGWNVTVVQHAPKPRGAWVPIGDLNDLAHLRFEWRRLPPQRTGFRGILPRRWVVERTFAWITRCRRLARDFEGLCASAEAFIFIALSKLMLTRLARLAS
jgi:putative transposase